MAFTVPLPQNAMFPVQARVDEKDWQMLAEAAGLGRGVLSGCAVTATATPSLNLDVASGTVQADRGTTTPDVTVNAGQVGLTVGGAQARVDLVVVDTTTGAKLVIKGPEASEPVMPAIPSNGTVLAAVYVPAFTEIIAGDMITDKRITVI